MARQNRWQQFGNAFNAVYDAGTALGQAIETGGIAFKDYEDEEGNALTGIALDRARNNDYAAAEQKYGDPMEALRIKTGFETTEQNKIKTTFDTDTYDDRVARIGIDNDSISAATTAQGLSNKFDAGTLNSRMVSENVTNRLNTEINKDPSAKKAGISKNKLSVATNNLKTSEANLMSKVLGTKEYQKDFVAAQLAEMGRFRAHNQNMEKIAESADTLALLKQNVKNNLKAAENAALEFDAQNDLLSNDAYQKAIQAGGIAEAQVLAQQGQNNLAALKKSAAISAAITTWSKNATAENPASMPELIETIKQLDPAVAMKLEQDYGEHQLWGITNDSLQMRARVNQAISTNGARGAMKVLDELNGDKFGMKIIKREGGGTAMVETQASGPGGTQDSIVRVIAEGKDEATFLTDLNAKMDPASMLQYAMNLNDMRYKDGVTAFNLAQAKAAGVGKPLSADQWAAGIMQNGGNEAQLMAASAYIFAEQPEMAASWVAKMMINNEVPTSAEVPKKLETKSTVNVNAPTTEEEATRAASVLTVVSDMSSSVADRKTAMSGPNKALLQKYHPQAYQLELNKNDAAAKIIESLKQSDGMLNLRNLNQLVSDFMTVEAGMSEGALSGKKDSNQIAYKLAANTIQRNGAEVLSIVRSMVSNGALKSRGGIDMTTLATGSNPEKTAAEQEQINSQVASLDELIKRLEASR